MEDSIRIIGARTEIGDVQEFVKRARQVFLDKGLVGQMVDSRYVLDRSHLELAFKQAERRFASGRGISRSLEMEFLLYLGATHQINVAIKRLGLREDTSHVLFVILQRPDETDPAALLEALGLTAEEPVYAGDPKAVLELFDISSTVADGSDIECVRKALYEQISLVNLEK